VILETRSFSALNWAILTTRSAPILCGTTKTGGIEWDRRKRILGHYDRIIRWSEITAAGDHRIRSDLEHIEGGDNEDIPFVPIGGSADDLKAGLSAIERIFDKQRSEERPANTLPDAVPSLKFNYTLQPIATRTTPHKGIVVDQIWVNEFALTQEEMKLRSGEPNQPVRVGVRFARPVRRLTVSHKFPEGYAPDSIEITVNGEPHTAEAQRVRRHLIYRHDIGLLHVELDWVFPGDHYEFKWVPPQLEQSTEASSQYGEIKKWLSRLHALSSIEVDTIQDDLQKVRIRAVDRLAQAINEANSSQVSFNPQDVDVSVWVYDPDCCMIRCIANTFATPTALREAQLPWGAGIRGHAMKRGRSEFYRRPITRNVKFYQRLDGYPEESHLLCVPIPLPPEVADALALQPEAEPVVNDCRMVVCLASMADGSYLGYLSDIPRRKSLCTDLLFEIADTLRTIDP
jgi:hypothetical protein